MPGFITHYICGQAVLASIPAEAERIINRHRSVYNMGTQGPDIFFYYLPGLLRERTRDIGTQMHKSHTGAFILNMAENCKRMRNKESRDVLFAYLAGYLTHYALDASAHPYVYFKTGVRKKGDKARAIRLSVNHRKFETAIDVLMLKLMSSEKPSDYKLWQLVRTDAKQAGTVAESVSSALQTVYGRDINPKDVYKAMAYMVQLTRIMQSQSGRRKRFMELIENLTIGEHLFSSIIHMQEVTDGVDYMNMGKTSWHFPGDTTQSKNESFVDLYREAVTNATDMIQMVYRHVTGSVSKSRLTQAIGNRSLATGTECTL